MAEMVTLAGADTITTGDPNSFEIGLEKLIERDPEVIVLGVNPFYEPTPDGSRGPARLGCHDRCQ